MNGIWKHIFSSLTTYITKPNLLAKHHVYNYASKMKFQWKFFNFYNPSVSIYISKLILKLTTVFQMSYNQVQSIF